jgi:hypothetical protein
MWHWWVELAVVDGHVGGKMKKLKVIAVHPAFRPVNTSDNMDEHAEGVHVAL